MTAAGPLSTRQNSLLEAVWVAEGVRLADYAFAQCACLREILLPPGCVLGKYALSQCTALRAMTRRRDWQERMQKQDGCRRVCCRVAGEWRCCVCRERSGK